MELFGENDYVNELVKYARIHRAVSLIMKDYADLVHDKNNHTETPLVLLSSEGDDVLQNYMKAMFHHYQEKSA